MADWALFLWCMNTISCTIKGIKASTAPAPRPITARPARWLSRLVDNPAHSPPAHASTAVTRSTGRRPMAMDSGTRKYDAIPFVIRGMVISMVTFSSDGGVTPGGMTAKGFSCVPLPPEAATKSISRIVVGSRPAYSSRKIGIKLPMTISAERAREPTVSLHESLDADPPWFRQMTSFCGLSRMRCFAYRNKDHRRRSIFSRWACSTDLYVDTISPNTWPSPVFILTHPWDSPLASVYKMISNEVRSNISHQAHSLESA